MGAAFSDSFMRVWLATSLGTSTELLGELMGLIVLPYLGVAWVRRERKRPCACLCLRGGVRRASVGVGGRRSSFDPLPGRSDASDLPYRAGVGVVSPHSRALSNRMVSEQRWGRGPGPGLEVARAAQTPGADPEHRWRRCRRGQPNAWEADACGPRGRTAHRRRRPRRQERAA